MSKTQMRALQNVTETARLFLARIDNITTEDFSKGGDRFEREVLRTALAALDVANA